jgi:hypothetical protein
MLNKLSAWLNEDPPSKTTVKVKNNNFLFIIQLVRFFALVLCKIRHLFLLSTFNKTKNLPSKLELGVGLTASLLKGYGASIPYRNQTIHPCLRLGYAYHSYCNGLLFKATIIPQLPGISNTFIDNTRKTSYNSPLIPSFCISIGKTF